MSGSASLAELFCKSAFAKNPPTQHFLDASPTKIWPTQDPEIWEIFSDIWEATAAYPNKDVYLQISQYFTAPKIQFQIQVFLNADKKGDGKEGTS